MGGLFIPLGGLGQTVAGLNGPRNSGGDPKRCKGGPTPGVVIKRCMGTACGIRV